MSHVRVDATVTRIVIARDRLGENSIQHFHAQTQKSELSMCSFVGLGN